MRLFLCLLVSFLTLSVTSQSLPPQWHITQEGRVMKAGGVPSSGMYDESAVKELRLYFSGTSYWTTLTQNYTAKKDLLAKMVFDGVTYDSIGVRFKGQTSYKMNPTEKKSFNITMDFVRPDQTIDGYQTLNLNNSWTDASFMREVLYYRLIRQHTPAPKAGFVRLFINDKDWGIYQNVQQPNKDFLREWYEDNDGINLRADVPDGTVTGGPGPGGGAMWGDGTAAINFLGPDTATYKKYYTLKSSSIAQPWQKLVDAARILNTTPLASLATEAPKVLDIDKILWHLACENIFGDDDSYIFKGKMDYYLYFDPITERWATYDYDANSTFINEHLTWTPFYNATKVNYPLLNKLLAVPEFRQRYLAHYRTLIDELLDESNVASLIDGYDKLIRDIVFVDPKKSTSNTNYISGLTILKSFVKTRKANMTANAEVATPSPLPENLEYAVHGERFGVVQAGDEVLVSCTVAFSKGILAVNLYYGNRLTSRFSVLPMHDDGVYGDATAGDGIYSVLMPKSEAGTLVRFYVEAIGNDLVKSRTYLPRGAEHECMFYRVEALTSDTKTVVVNEFMAANTGVIKDEFGETEDWIELHNLTGSTIDLAGYHISDTKDNLTKYTFPEGVTIAPGGYLIIWADEDGTQGKHHANFKLSQNGESIFLLNKNTVLIDSLTFGPQTANLSSARKPNGTGTFSLGQHTFSANNDGTSATQQEIQPVWRLVPNPAGEYFTIEGTDLAVHVRLTDMQGTLLLQTICEPGQKIDISHLPAGMYSIGTDRRNTLLVITR